MPKKHSATHAVVEEATPRKGVREEALGACLPTRRRDCAQPGELGVGELKGHQPLAVVGSANVCCLRLTQGSMPPKCASEAERLKEVACYQAAFNCDVIPRGKRPMPWYIQDRFTDSVTGPFDAAQLQAMAAEGRLEADAQVSKSQEGPWVPASRVKGLMPAASPELPARSNPISPASGDTPQPWKTSATSALKYGRYGLRRYHNKVYQVRITGGFVGYFTGRSGAIACIAKAIDAANESNYEVVFILPDEFSLPRRLLSLLCAVLTLLIWYPLQGYVLVLRRLPD